MEHDQGNESDFGQSDIDGMRRGIEAGLRARLEASAMNALNHSPDGEYLAVGIDIIGIERFTGVLDRRGADFLDRVFRPAELERAAGRPERLAARFAAKEAVSKALGTGIGEIDWKDVEVVTEESGAPRLVLHGRAAALAGEKGIYNFSLSLTHDADLALAFVVGRRQTK